MNIRAIVHLVVDDDGQDLIEYALLSGVIGVAGVVLYPVIAGRMGDAYTGWQTAIKDAWEPCPPAPAACP
jgi:Flp pilus assembly pilin Flp